MRAWNLVPAVEVGTYVAVAFSLLAAVGVLCLAIGFLRTWLRTRTWIKVTARVLSWDYEEKQKDGRTQYLVHAKYEYEVNGTRYEGSGTDDMYLDEDEVRGSKEDGKKPGDEIQAYYDPKHPEKAVISRTSGGCGWVLVVLAVIFFGLAGYCVFEALPERKPLPAEAPELPRSERR